jgi:hypothetical protein
MSDFSLVGGIGVMGFISPKNINDTYAVIDPLYGIDGLRNVSSLDELNSITHERRRAGMIVGVGDGEVYYKLKSTPWVFDISDWIEIDFTKQIYVDKETPKGEMDGTNKTFILSKEPIPNSEHIYLNGLLQEYGDHYLIEGYSINFISPIPSGWKIRCSYRSLY